MSHCIDTDNEIIESFSGLDPPQTNEAMWFGIGFESNYIVRLTWNDCDLYALFSGATVQFKCRVKDPARYLTDDEIHALLDESDADLSDSEDIDSVAKDLQEDSDSESEMDDSPEDTNPLRRGQTALKWSSGTFPALTIEDEVLSQECENPDTPLKYFLKYFPEEFWEECAFQTNLYSVQVRGKSVQTDAKELKIFVGIHIAMGILKLPRVRLYWSRMFRVDWLRKRCPETGFLS
ncbi:hypothetical protein HPB48_013124 [Haemaphysalis longicornis]|uniref:PiggyBac transposable element-derived protein domain-containing protein n=1 Tax=Haemaphysalis longicornis TaxID=44386 RepID=A0A9J6H5B4_HAELO|nr:hypothetical protein HPB48_013124 [Haemaphysalis longicornis]